MRKYRRRSRKVSDFCRSADKGEEMRRLSAKRRREITALIESVDGLRLSEEGTGAWKKHRDNKLPGLTFAHGWARLLTALDLPLDQGAEATHEEIVLYYGLKDGTANSVFINAVTTLQRSLEGGEALRRWYSRKFGV